MAQLLKYRKSIEDQKRIAVAAVVEKQYREQEKLSHIMESQSWCHKHLKDGDGDVAFLLASLDSLSRGALTQKVLLRKLEEALLEAKGELSEASKSRKTVEKLREREFERYKKEALKQERKFLDEVATNRFAGKYSDWK